MFFIDETASVGAEKASAASVWTPIEVEAGIERSERVQPPRNDYHFRECTKMIGNNNRKLATVTART